MSWTVVLFPDPLGPTKAVVSPAFTFRLRSFKIWKSCSGTEIVFENLHTKKCYRQRKWPWHQAGTGNRKWHCGTGCRLLLCLVYIPLLSNSRFPVPVKPKSKNIIFSNFSSYSASVASWFYPIDGVKDALCSCATRGKRLQTGGGLTQVHRCHEDSKKHLQTTIAINGRINWYSEFHFDSAYLNKAAWRQLLGVNDQVRSVPKGQSVAEEDYAPQVSLKDAYDGPFFHAPILSLHQVSVIPVHTFRFILILINCSQQSIIWLFIMMITPLGLFLLATKRSHCSDGWQHLVSHCARLRVGLQLSARQPGHTLQEGGAILENNIKIITATSHEVWFITGLVP